MPLMMANRRHHTPPILPIPSRPTHMYTRARTCVPPTLPQYNESDTSWKKLMMLVQQLRKVWSLGGLVRSPQLRYLLPSMQHRAAGCQGFAEGAALPMLQRAYVIAAARGTLRLTCADRCRRDWARCAGVQPPLPVWHQRRARL